MLLKAILLPTRPKLPAMRIKLPSLSKIPTQKEIESLTIGSSWPKLKPTSEILKFSFSLSETERHLLKKVLERVRPSSEKMKPKLKKLAQGSDSLKQKSEDSEIKLMPFEQKSQLLKFKSRDSEPIFQLPKPNKTDILNKSSGLRTEFQLKGERLPMMNSMTFSEWSMCFRDWSPQLKAKLTDITTCATGKEVFKLKKQAALLFTLWKEKDLENI